MVDPGIGGNPLASDDRFKFERRAALLAGIVVVGFILYLVQRNTPFADPNLVVMMRIVLSLSVGILGATIPGFLEVEYNLAGFVIRAGGALALFVITFFGTPYVNSNFKPPEPKISVLEPKLVDFRTEAMPTKDEAERANAPTLVTIPTEVFSEAEPARKATLSSSKISLTLNNIPYEFTWRDFVNMHPEKSGVWLAIDESAHSYQIDPGSSVYKEILHQPTHATRWADFVQSLIEDSSSSLKINQYLTLNGITDTAVCTVNLSVWRPEIKKFIDLKKTLPGRITMDCGMAHG